MGGGGGNTQTQTTSQQIPPELRGAYRAAGNIGTEVLTGMAPNMAGYFQDQTPQQVAGPTGLEDLSYQTAAGMLGQGPEAWSQALGMFSGLGNLPQWQGVDLSGVSGFGPSPQSPYAYPKAGPVGPAGGAASGYGQGQEGGGYGGSYGPVGPGTGGSAGFQVQTPEGTNTPYTQASPYGGIKAPGMGSGVPTGNYASYMGGGGGGGGGGGAIPREAMPEWVGNPLESIDFANHPALQSALDTFAKTSLPGIENSMIGAGLGRSGAAANAISTGKAQIALPVMQQLLNLEMQNKGLDVNQRATDIGSLTTQRGQDTSLAASRAANNAALAQARLSQQAAMRGQDINALLQQGSQALQARGQDINALLGGAQGLTGLGQADVGRIQDAITQAMGVGGAYRDIGNAQAESEFQAANRPFDRTMQMLGLMAPGAMGSGGTTTVTRGGGGK